MNKIERIYPVSHITYKQQKDQQQNTGKKQTAQESFESLLEKESDYGQDYR